MAAKSLVGTANFIESAPKPPDSIIGFGYEMHVGAWFHWLGYESNDYIINAFMYCLPGSETDMYPTLAPEHASFFFNPTSYQQTSRGRQLE